MPTIAVASDNPVKIQAALLGFQRMFPAAQFDIVGVATPSGVSDQPMTDAETLAGARQRAHNVQARVEDADYWVGIEGGVQPHGGALEAFAWVVVLGRERTGHSRTASFTLPDEITALVRQGVELGLADDAVFGREDSKRHNGSVGLLTHDVIDRTEYYAHAVTLALIPFLWPALTFAE